MRSFELCIALLIALCSCGLTVGAGSISRDLSNEKMLKVSLVGFDTESSQRSLNVLLGSPEISMQSMNDSDIRIAIRNGNEPMYLTKEIGRVSRSDLSFVFIDGVLLLDENLILRRMSDAISAVIGCEGKKALRVLFTGSSSQAKFLTTLLYEAWEIFDKEGYKTGDLTTEFDVQIILMPASVADDTKLPKETLAAINTTFETLQRTARPLNELVSAEQPRVMQQRIAPSMVDFTHSESVELVRSGAMAALAYARSAANASIARLQRIESATEFSGFVSNLQDSAAAAFGQVLSSRANADSQRLVDDPTFAAMKRNTLLDVRKNIFNLLLPFFKRQVQLVRDDLAEQFNRFVADELELTIRVMDDLAQHKRNILRTFDSRVDALIPRDAPRNSWNAAGERYLFENDLDQFLRRKEAQEKLVGVLPRGRQPIDVSFYTFLNHPLGRDYRQDVLTGNARDALFFSDSLAKTEASGVHPVDARAALKSKIADKVAKSPSSVLDCVSTALELRRLRQKSEFARELQMLPLSIKNPDVPMSGGRRARASGPPPRDSRRAEEGPERFLVFDLPPLPEVQSGLAAIRNSAAAPMSAPSDGADGKFAVLRNLESNRLNQLFIDKVVRYLPKVSATVYEVPTVGYGSRYSPH